LCKKGYVWADWTDFENKKLWQILELIIIPLILAITLFILDRFERKADREINLDNQRERLLQNYFDAMTSLILDNNLMKSNEHEIQEIARVKTLTTLKSLDGVRKGELIIFLKRTGLLNKLDVKNEQPNN